MPVDQEYRGRPLHFAGRALIATTDGVLDYDPQQISAGPGKLAQQNQASTVVWALFPSAHGLVTLSPLPDPSSFSAHWYIQWYSASR